MHSKNIMIPPDFLSQFFTAVAAPITTPVAWSEAVPLSHPLRQLKLFVRYWPAAVAGELAPLLEADGGIRKTYWFCIAATVCDEKGEPAFGGLWQSIYDVEMNKRSTPGYAAPTEQKLLPVLPLDDQGQRSYPPIDFYLVGEKLKEMFNASAQGQVVMGELYDASMSYNGWKLSAVGKSSETTPLSQPSTEKAVVEA